MSAQHGRPSRLPLMAEVAAMLRAGEPLADIAARYSVKPGTIQTLLNDAGWGRDGHPNTKPKPRPLFVREADEQPWAEQALCAQIGGEAWFPEKGDVDDPKTNAFSVSTAKKVCARCPVRTPCLDYALRNDERFGVWGGTTERERRRLKKERAS
jgi:WhiB family redox-sensing transcriptional regulator